MSKKLVSIIFLGMLLLLAGCGKAVVDMIVNILGNGS